MIPARVWVRKKRPEGALFLLRDGLGLFAEFEGGVVGYGHVDAGGEVVDGYGVATGGYLDAGGVVNADCAFGFDGGAVEGDGLSVVDGDVGYAGGAYGDVEHQGGAEVGDGGLYYTFIEGVDGELIG